MRSIKLGCVLFFTGLMAWGCGTSRASQPRRTQVAAPVERVEPPGRCDRGLGSIGSAASPTIATEAVEGYLSCVATWSDAPPLNLEDRVTSALADNPYPRVRRKASDIRARFFDRSLLKTLPQTRRELAPYVELLKAQTLRARAEKDDRFIQAAEKRAKSLATLSRVLDALEAS